MLKVDSGLYEAVNVERRTTVGAAVVAANLLDCAVPRVYLAPGGPVGHGGTSARDAVDDKDGVGHGVRGDQLYARLFHKVRHLSLYNHRHGYKGECENGG